MFMQAHMESVQAAGVDVLQPMNHDINTTPLIIPTMKYTSLEGEELLLLVTAAVVTFRNEVLFRTILFWTFAVHPWTNDERTNKII